MAPKNRETPRERYVSAPLTEEEKRDLPIKRAQALAMGEPVVIEGARGDSLELLPLGCAIDSDSISLTMRVTGTVNRTDAIAIAKGESVTIKIPAKVRSP
jgi:hypothetical protein